ncbi:uncharacterized protein LOC125178183 [Hyalella azteca]|uniref:Uncharacterized protein LOC125178183 n=1 Tax=Hyalella azteca TaxID=294128 RepID=A0A979FL96_HYAAZ|nr:uncharacterized protein LOC125178183 [Hyalella azteca]
MASLWNSLLDFGSICQCMASTVCNFVGCQLDMLYLGWVTSLLYPAILTIFILPFFILFFLYFSSLILYIYTYRWRQVKEVLQEGLHDPWAGGRYLISVLWDAHGYIWHGYEVQGIENVPVDRGALIVYYHGAIPVDIYYFVARFITSTGRHVHCVGDRFLQKIPGWHSILEAFRISPSSVSDCVRIVRAGHLLAISPGGVREAQFSDHSYPLLWGCRKGFAKVAIEANCPIIPMFTRNVREAFRVMNFPSALFSALYRRFKLPFAPIYGGFPVKMVSYLGPCVYPLPDESDEQLAQRVERAVRSLIVQHQRLPGNILAALLDRIHPSLARSLLGAGTPPPHIAEAPPTHSAEAPPSHTAEAPPFHTAEAPTHTAEAPTHTAEAPPSHTAEAPHSHTAEAPPSHTAEAPPTHTAEAPPTHTAEAPPTHTAEAPPSRTAHEHKSKPGHKDEVVENANKADEYARLGGDVGSDSTLDAATDDDDVSDVDSNHETAIEREIISSETYQTEKNTADKSSNLLHLSRKQSEKEKITGESELITAISSGVPESSDDAARSYSRQSNPQRSPLIAAIGDVPEEEFQNKSNNPQSQDGIRRRKNKRTPNPSVVLGHRTDEPQQATGTSEPIAEESQGNSEEQVQRFPPHETLGCDLRQKTSCETSDSEIDRLVFEKEAPSETYYTEQKSSTGAAPGGSWGNEASEAPRYGGEAIDFPCSEVSTSNLHDKKMSTVLLGTQSVSSEASTVCDDLEGATNFEKAEISSPTPTCSSPELLSSKETPRPTEHLEAARHDDHFSLSADEVVDQKPAQKAAEDLSFSENGKASLAAEVQLGTAASSDSDSSSGSSFEIVDSNKPKL